MKSYFTVKIPTTSVLKKFINKLYLQPNAEAIKIDNKCLFGTVLISLLNKPNIETNLNKFEEQKKFSNYNTQIVCVGMWSLMSHYGTEINMNQAIQVNRFFEELFDLYLYVFCKKNVNESKRVAGYDKSILAFADLYGIEIDVDISFEGLKKKEYRYRKNQEEKIMGVLSSDSNISKNAQQLLFVI